MHDDTYEPGDDRLNDDNSEETDEEFNWFDPLSHLDDTYFNLVNKNRRTVQAGE